MSHKNERSEQISWLRTSLQTLSTKVKTQYHYKSYKIVSPMDTFGGFQEKVNALVRTQLRVLKSHNRKDGEADRHESPACQDEKKYASFFLIHDTLTYQYFAMSC